MPRTHLDRKNLNLAKLLYRLRQSIDVYRVIGLNTAAAKQMGAESISPAFFGYCQEVAQDEIALGVCKIFEYEKRGGHKANSISGVMARLDKHRFTAIQAKNVERFGQKYGNKATCTKPTEYLRDTVRAFKKQHERSLQRLRDFRNQYVAHSQFDAKKVKSLPSLDEYEAIFDFAADFYRLVSGGILNIGPAFISPRAGMGVLHTLKKLGLTDAKFDFPLAP